MPRFRRLHAPGALVHIIARFVNREFRITQPYQRAEYLHRVARGLERTDFTLLAYAIMSSHIHLLVLAALAESAKLILPVHGGFAGWLNREQGRFGPVFGDRHSTVLCDVNEAARVIAYLHNNPVRAGVVCDPAASSWTSHRAYLESEGAPPWLNVDAGLQLSGFETSASGRLAFHDFVCDQRGVTPAEMSDQGLTAMRARIRREVGAAVEVSSVHVAGGERRVELVTVQGAPVTPLFHGTAMDVVAAVAERLGMSAEGLQARDRRRRIVRARRLALRIWSTCLRQPQSAMAAVLGLSQQAASHLLATDDSEGDTESVVRGLLQSHQQVGDR